MSKSRWRFKPRELKRAIETVEAATGLPARRVEVDKDGKFIIMTGKPVNDESERNEWDEAFNGKDQTAPRSGV